jgi:hypothetical protein
MPVTITGASDDLIELDDDICEEFTYLDTDGGDLVALSDETVARVVFDSDGVWRITVVAKGAGAATLIHASLDDGHTDELRVEGPISWAVHGVTMARAGS